MSDERPEPPPIESGALATGPDGIELPAPLVSARPSRRNAVDSVPHDPEAEQSVLGSIMLDNDAIFDVQEIMQPEDLHREQNRLIYRAMLDLSGANEPIDMVTMNDQLTKMGAIKQAGGLPYLTELHEFTPYAGNVAKYAKIVKEAAQDRRLIEAAHRIARSAMERKGKSADRMAAAEQEIFAATQGRVTTGPKLIRHYVTDVYRRIEEIADSGGAITGVTTGIDRLNVMTRGWQRGDLIVIAGRPSMGKAQPLTAKVLTPTGFVPMGQIRKGDMVIGEDGKPVEVVGVFPQGHKQVFRVEMSDQSTTECCDDHLWFTQTRNERRRGERGSVKPLKAIRQTLQRQDNTSPNHAIPVVEPVSFEPAGTLSLHPWLLGALIGDGGFTSTSILFTKPEQDITEKVIRTLPHGDMAVAADKNSKGAIRIRKTQRGKMQPSETMRALRVMKLAGLKSAQKFIPDEYKRASVSDRVQLMQGLFDTDGYVPEVGSVQYSTSSPRLAQDVMDLVRSLGGICGAESKIPTYRYKGEKKEGLRSWRLYVRFPNGLVPVSSQKHLAKWRMPSQMQHRSILKVEPKGIEPCQCIMVASVSGLYVTDEFIVTHNTSFAMDSLSAVVMPEDICPGSQQKRGDDGECLVCREVKDGNHIPDPQPGLAFSMEMRASALTERMFANRSRINHHSMMRGKLRPEDWRHLAEGIGKINQCPLYIDDTNGLTVMDMRSRARRVRTEAGGLALIVVDYLQLAAIVPSAHEQTTAEQIGDIAKGLKDLAKEMACPVIVLSQLNRSLEKREDKRPIMSDLAQSGSIEAHADVILFPYRPWVYNKNEPDDLVELIISKQRNGPTGTVTAKFHKSYMRFENDKDDQPQQEWG